MGSDAHGHLFWSPIEVERPTGYRGSGAGFSVEASRHQSGGDRRKGRECHSSLTLSVALELVQATGAPLTLGSLLTEAGNDIATDFPLNTARNYVTDVQRFTQVEGCVLGVVGQRPTQTPVRLSMTRASPTIAGFRRRVAFRAPSPCAGSDSIGRCYRSP